MSVSDFALRFKYQLLFPMLSKLPASIGYRIASLYGYYEQRRHTDLAAAIDQQMHRALPNEPLRDHWVKHHFGLMNREILDTWFYPRLDTIEAVNALIDVKNIQPLIDARAEGRPVIITSGHYSRFWMVGIVMAAYGIPLATLARDSMDKNTWGLPEPEFAYRKLKLERLQQRYGGQFLLTDKTMRPLFRELNKNPVAILMDVPYAKGTSGLLPIELFGHTAYVADGIAKIARKTGALIQPYFIEEDRSGLSLEFLPPLEPMEQDVDTMQTLMLTLEQRIRQKPGQWFQWPALPLFWNEV